MKIQLRRCIGAVLAALLSLQAASAYAATTVELAIAGIVREPPKQTGKTIGGWPVGIYADNRRISDACLKSGNADRAGAYNLLAPNVPSNLQRCWVLSDTREGTSDPVLVDLPNPIPSSPYAKTADELIVRTRPKGIAEREAAVNYTSAVIEDQSVRVFVGAFGDDHQKALATAKNNLMQRAGLVVVEQYKGEPTRDPSNRAFWDAVYSRIKEWSGVPTGQERETLFAIVWTLTADLEKKTIDDPRPSSYTLWITGDQQREVQIEFTAVQS